MPDMDLTNELLANIDRQIADEEAKVRDRLARSCRHDDHDTRKLVNDEWHSFHKRIQPLRDQRDYIVKQLVAIEACKPPPMMVIPNGSSAMEKERTVKFNKPALVAAIDEIEDLASRWCRSGGVIEFDNALRRHYPLFRDTLMRAAKLEASVKPFPRPRAPE